MIVEYISTTNFCDYSVIEINEHNFLHNKEDKWYG